jgi:hypothetical protein
MDRSRKATRKGNEITLQHKSQREAALTEEMIEEKLAQLQASIEQVRGIAALQRRVKHFGECQPIEGETSGEFYEKLRHWFDRDLPQAKSPRHPPRQTGG